MERPEPKFVPGEAAVVQSAVCPECNGQRIMILEAKYGLFRVRTTEGSIEKWCWMYRADIASPIGRGWWGERSLHKLPPDEKTQWDASIWQPKEVTA